ncbi:cupin domain-containing protein [Edaphobacter albus]|uniref:cupin domain-containing protein n=1 Tax=Edaphobacter sp. 4G125 TaxID=2763071 RepID=UPI001644578E|nr:cupin domain-containing protein [Edaphobacter sp. 4G125]QNI38263.1 cupin domain-containing protein [Edaphobacter sp. 4G125]
MKSQILCSLLFATVSASAQAGAQTAHTAAEIQQHQARLLEAAKASATGMVNEKTDETPVSRTLFVARARTGEAELHQHWSDQMVISKGSVILITGGTLKGQHPNGDQPGEFLATSIEGGKEVTLHAGDIAHIPAGVPHWVKLTPNTTATYIVFKQKVSQ